MDSGEGVFTERDHLFEIFIILPLCSTGVRVETTSETMTFFSSVAYHLFVKIEDLFEREESCIPYTIHLSARMILLLFRPLNCPCMYSPRCLFPLVSTRTAGGRTLTHQPCISFS